MKLFLFFVSSLLSLQSIAQCTECISLKEALKNPAIVTSLTLNPLVSKVQTDSVPAEIEKFINLEILYLSDNPITSIPDRIGKLTKLKELSFAGCKLQKIPDIVFTLKNLKELILFDNPFSEEYTKELKQKVKELMPKTKLML